MEILDSMAKCVPEWWEMCPVFLSYGCVTTRVRLTLSISRGILPHLGMENVKMSIPARGHQCLPVGVI